MNNSSRHVSSKSALHRLWVTLIVIAICIGARFIPLPIPANTDPRFNPPNLNLAFLGTRPFESSFVLVELAALAIPALRRRRTGSPAQRAGLYRAAILLGLLFSLVQACIVDLSLRAGGHTSPAWVSLVRIAVLTAMALAYVVLAAWVHRDGLGSGFLVVISTSLLTAVIDWLRQVGAAFHSGELNQSAIDALPWVIAFAVASALWLGGRYSLPNADGTEPRLLSRPACGLAPLGIAPAMVTVIQRVEARLHPAAGPGFSAHPALISALTIGAVIGFAYCFHRPKWVARWWKCLVPSHTGTVPRWHSGLLEALIFTGIITALTLWQEHRVPSGARIPALHVVILTVLARELWLEWKRHQSSSRWVPVWEIHQAYATAPALEMLEKAGVRAQVANRHVRGLLQVFGPYAPIRIYVAEPDVDKAGALFRDRWPDLQS